MSFQLVPSSQWLVIPSGPVSSSFWPWFGTVETMNRQFIERWLVEGQEGWWVEFPVHSRWLKLILDHLQSGGMKRGDPRDRKGHGRHFDLPFVEPLIRISRRHELRFRCWKWENVARVTGLTCDDSLSMIRNNWIGNWTVSSEKCPTVAWRADGRQSALIVHNLRKSRHRDVRSAW